MQLHAARPAPDDPQDAVSGFLACTGCQKAFPIVDGVPIVVKDVDTYIEQHLALLCMRQDLPAETLAFLLRSAPEGDHANLFVYLNAYLVAHYPELARAQGIEPTPTGEPRWWGVVEEELRAALKELGGTPRVLVVGCSVGRELSILAGLGARVFALESSFAAARVAQQLSRGQCYRGLVGVRNEQLRAFEVPGFSGRACDVIVGDIQDPPFAGYSFDMIVALNLLDAVPSPLTALQQCHALVRKGGQLLLASPWHWSRGTEPRARLGDSWRAVGGEREGLDVLLALLGGEGLPGIKAEVLALRKRVPWILRRHDQAFDVFLSDMVRVRT